MWLPAVLVCCPAGGEGGVRRRKGRKRERWEERKVEGGYKSPVMEHTLHLTLAANGSVVCTAALCTALTGGRVCEQHTQSNKTAKHVHTSSRYHTNANNYIITYHSRSVFLCQCLLQASHLPVMPRQRAEPKVSEIQKLYSMSVYRTIAGHQLLICYNQIHTPDCLYGIFSYTDTQPPSQGTDTVLTPQVSLNRCPEEEDGAT